LRRDASTLKRNVVEAERHIQPPAFFAGLDAHSVRLRPHVHGASRNGAGQDVNVEINRHARINFEWQVRQQAA
jgi:hypothetical protein